MPQVHPRMNVNQKRLEVKHLGKDHAQARTLCTPDAHADKMLDFITEEGFVRPVSCPGT
jgi:hypothetical protein